MPKKPKPARKTKKHAEPKTPRLGDVAFGPDGACCITFNIGVNFRMWHHHADALMDIVAPPWSWSHPCRMLILDHTTGRRLA